jgi:hypothetical protein
MARWIQLSDGSWAVNLDGSDPRVTFSTPRVEVRTALSSWKYNALTSEHAWRTGGGHATVSAAQRAGLLALVDRVSAEHQRVISELIGQFVSYADSLPAR